MVISFTQAYTLAKVLKRVAIREDIIILTSANQALLIKNFSGLDLAEQPIVTGKEFTVTQEPISNLQSKNK